MSRWQGGQFVPIRFKLLESQIFREWMRMPRSFMLYTYMRRFVWRSRAGRLGGYYQRGFLCVEGYLGTWADAFGVHKTTISREIKWMIDRHFVRLMRDSRSAGGNKSNIYALGQVYDIAGGTDEDAIEIFYADHFCQESEAIPLIIDDGDETTQLIALTIRDDPQQLLIPRGPVAPMQQVVAPTQQVVAPTQQVVAPMQRSNREVIEKNRERNREGQPLAFPETENPHSISSSPGDPPLHTETVEAAESAGPLELSARCEAVQGDRTRPAGWERCKAGVYRLCEHVAGLWRLTLPVVKPEYNDGTAEMARRQVTDWQAGASLLLSAFGDDEVMARDAIDAYHSHLQTARSVPSITSTKSLINLVPAFAAQGNHAGTSSVPARVSCATM